MITMIIKITRVVMIIKIVHEYQMIIKIVHENQTLLSPLALLLPPSQGNDLKLSYLDMVMFMMMVLMRISMVMMIT